MGLCLFVYRIVVWLFLEFPKGIPMNSIPKAWEGGGFLRDRSRNTVNKTFIISYGRRVRGGSDQGSQLLP